MITVCIIICCTYTSYAVASSRNNYPERFIINPHSCTSYCLNLVLLCCLHTSATHTYCAIILVPHITKSNMSYRYMYMYISVSVWHGLSVNSLIQWRRQEFESGGPNAGLRKLAAASKHTMNKLRHLLKKVGSKGT